MPIFFDEKSKVFHLTDESQFSYILKISKDPDDALTLVHTYWGPALGDGSLAYLEGEFSKGLASFDGETQNLAFAYPTSGRGDFRPAALRAVGADGTNCAILSYIDYSISHGKQKLAGLPAIYTESQEEADTLSIRMEDKLTGLRVTLAYTVMNCLHALTQSVLFENNGKQLITLQNPASACVTLRGEYDMLHLHGAWAKERTLERVMPMHGIREINSSRGASGHEHNPFIALMERDVTEYSGNCYGLSLVYSGSFKMLVDENAYGYTRIVGGLNECAWQLNPSENLQMPEMVLVFSDKGLSGMSHIFHKLYRSRLCRGTWRDKPRPVLVNNWEGTYFDFNTQRLLGIARKAADIGAELFVLDDGWFGKRNHDNCSLGDWVVNEEKLPGGLGHLAREINGLGLKFGLWFEPEMVSPDSDLYRLHPDWCLHVPGRPRSQRRNQLILDMSRQDVQDHIIAAVCSVLNSANIEYVKWDMNRNYAETGSALLPPQQQGEVHHRYMLGLYRVLETVVSRFPQILFESCSGGGGRFDAGMLFYMPQTWTSDDTDAVERLFIQYGTSIPYPPSAMGAHVSAVPNHQVGRTTSLEMRAHVAMSGNFGYELDLSALSDEELVIMRSQIAFVKEIRQVTQYGNYTRLRSPFEGNLAAWQFTSHDQSEVIVFLFRRYANANNAADFILIRDIDVDNWYVDDAGRKYHGSALRHIGLVPPFLYVDHAAAPPQDAASAIVRLRRV